MECPICKDHFKPGDTNIIVVKHTTDNTIANSKKRGHFFHRDCMQRWGEKSCPLDRDPFTRMYHIDYRVLDGLNLLDFSCYYVLLKDIKISDDVIKNIRNINSQDESGKTLFYLACQNGNIKLVRKLFRIGANPLIANSDGFTPLMIAICNFHKPIYQYLLRNKAVRGNISVSDNKGRTAFYYAAKNSNISAVKAFLNNYLLTVKEIERFLIYEQQQLMERKDKTGHIIVSELVSYCKLLKTTSQK